MTNEPAGWRELPFHEELRELTIVGSGKDCSLLVRVPDGRGFGIPLGSYGGRVSVKGCSNIVITTKAVDDSALAIDYRPQAGFRMRFARAAVNYAGSDEDWAEDAVWERMNRAQWPVEMNYTAGAIDIELATWADSEPERGPVE